MRFASSTSSAAVEQRVAAGLVEEHLERIGCVEAGADAEVELGLLLLLRRRAVRVELLGERLRLGLVEVVRQDGVGNVGRGDHPVLVAQVEQALEGLGDGRGRADCGQADFGQRTPSVFEDDGRAVCASSVTHSKRLETQRYS